MPRIAQLLPLVIAGGCFYLDPIVERPSIEILPELATPVFRGDVGVKYDAVGTDPQHKPISFDWKIFACSDGTDASTCDASPVPHAESGNTSTFDVPVFLLGTTTPVQALRILVGARDTAGATSASDQLLVVPVSDHPPTLALRNDSRHGFVVSAPISIFAKIQDPDDGPTPVTIAWNVFTPSVGAGYTLDDLAATQDPNVPPVYVQYGKTFTPQIVGSWTIEVVATDPLGAATKVDEPITVVADHPPCLAQVGPIVPPAGQTLPITDPTLFLVDSVADDLDPYPPTPNDPVTGVTQFQWSIEQPGTTTHVPLVGATDNRMSLDPATYTPGDIVELRVEIFDRNHTPITCTDSMATCSVISDNTCIQRQTWRVEMR